MNTLKNTFKVAYSFLKTHLRVILASMCAVMCVLNLYVVIVNKSFPAIVMTVLFGATALAWFMREKQERERSRR